MKKLFMILAFVLISNANAYMIGNMYANLLSCDYGQYGYKYGYIGTYKGSDNNIYRIFFGNNYCQY